MSMAASPQPIRAEKGENMATRNLAAVDLGAESGRVILARFDGQNLGLEEVHRFPNQPVMMRGHRFWNMPGLWNEVLVGLRKARQLAGRLDSVGVDTWGVDYGLVDRNGLLLGLPFQYRDQRTGIQFLPINTLYQLYAHERMQPGDLGRAHRLLLIPDLLHNWLCGSELSEYTNATTTQCWDPVAGVWATDLLDQLAIPSALLPPVVEAGTLLGEVLPEWRDDFGVTKVVAPATHDTGSAIAALPAQHADGWGYISSGTWSLVGVELPQPVMPQESLSANFTNEGGVFGTTRYLKNIMGLWLLQECQRICRRDGHPVDYDMLLAAVDAVPAFAALI